MGLVLFLLVVAMALGGVGLFVGSLKWVLITALALLVVGALAGLRSGGPY